MQSGHTNSRQNDGVSLMCRNVFDIYRSFTLSHVSKNDIILTNISLGRDKRVVSEVVAGSRFGTSIVFGSSVVFEPSKASECFEPEFPLDLLPLGHLP